MTKFFDDSELEDVFAQLNADIENNKRESADDYDKEIQASQRRYEEIIKKNSN